MTLLNIFSQNTTEYGSHDDDKDILGQIIRKSEIRRADSQHSMRLATTGSHKKKNNNNCFIVCRCLRAMPVISKYTTPLRPKNKANNYKLESNFGNIACLSELLLYLAIYGLFN